MPKLNAKQAAFAENKAAGLTNHAAAIAAGYAPAAAKQTATKLMQHPGIRAAIKAATKPRVGAEDEPRMLSKYASSLELLRHTYNNPKMPDAMRIRAAEQALPYEHARIGEAGKKEKARERAQEIAAGGKHKFTPKTPPVLKVVRP